ALDIRLAALVLVGAVLVTPAASDAQEEEPSAPPEGWVVVTDRGGHGGGELEFVDMPPGFHITTGPAAIFFDPEMRAEGSYRVESTIHLFDPGRRNEAFGLFIGGSDLEGEGQEYTYFLIRRDGGTLVKRREGASTSNVRGWTPHDAVATWDEREEGAATVENTLAIEATDDELIFEVNGEEVYRADRAELAADGIVGLRVNHGLNLHVTALDVRPGG
ncbi:MAG: hypothetical protein R3266_04235, partial [Gemmatimonadota bacterium]|nr:hypothetical protein [Gemmatimonadota bacterium]